MRGVLRPSALVAHYFDMLTPPQAATVRTLQTLIQTAAPQLDVMVKWGNLCFMVERKVLLALAVHDTTVHLQVFNGALLATEFPELGGGGSGLRHLKLRYSQPVDADRVTALVQAAVALGPRPDAQPR